MEYRHIIKIPNIANSTRRPIGKDWDVSPKEFRVKRKAPTPYTS